MHDDCLAHDVDSQIKIRHQARFCDAGARIATAICYELCKLWSNIAAAGQCHRFTSQKRIFIRQRKGSVLVALSTQTAQKRAMQRLQLQHASYRRPKLSSLSWNPDSTFNVMVRRMKFPMSQRTIRQCTWPSLEMQHTCSAFTFTHFSMSTNSAAVHNYICNI
jgi:hypothetical protein